VLPVVRAEPTARFPVFVEFSVHPSDVEVLGGVGTN
jgi:hypothetical protein